MVGLLIDANSMDQIIERVPVNLWKLHSKRIVDLVPRPDRVVIGWVIAIKILLVFFGTVAFRALENKHLPPQNGWLAIWNRWDALHYLEIAKSGYGLKQSALLVFYPLYPWSVWLLAAIDGNYLVSAFIVSGVASAVAAVMLRRLVQLDYGIRLSLRAVWFFLIFPTAYFLHIGYTESLFLAFALSAFLAARREVWWLAGVLGALCWMTRPTGIALVPALAIEAAHQMWTKRQWNWQWLWIGLVPLGFAVFLLVNFRVTGDAFTFLHIRKSVFAITGAWPWTGIHNVIGNFNRNPNQAEIVGRQEFYFTALGFVCAVMSWIKLRPSYAMWITGIWSLFTFSNFIQSAPRHALTLFPIFIFFAMMSKDRIWNAVLTVWSILFLALFSSLFLRGWWAF
jgi:Mannosyltransferase (PIG-V)